MGMCQGESDDLREAPCDQLEVQGSSTGWTKEKTQEL